MADRNGLPDAHDYAAGRMLTDGRTPRTWPENASPTPQQLAAWLRTCTDTERAEFADAHLRMAADLSSCFARDHQTLETEYPVLTVRAGQLERDNTRLREAYQHLRATLAEEVGANLPTLDELLRDE